MSRSFATCVSYRVQVNGAEFNLELATGLRDVLTE